MQTINDIISEGFTFHQCGKLDEAENFYNEALDKAGENAEIYNLLGVLKLQKNEIEEALQYVEKAVLLKPCEYYYETLFQAYIRAGLYNKIVNCANTVLKNNPKSFSLLFNLAMAYKNLRNNKEAIKYYNQALKINPTSFQAWFNLAHIYNVENQGKNAVSALKVCQKLRPNDREVDYFLSITLMRIKDYNRGLKLFESRLCKETAVKLINRTYPNLAAMNKLWHGENIKDKTLFVYYEAGYGDVIMFSRYLPLVKQKCKKLIFYPQRQLVPLFTENSLGVDEIIDGYIPEKNMNFDVHAPLLSLPYLLGLKGKKVFYTSEGYMRGNNELAEEYRKQYFNNDKIKIAIKWQGNTYYDKDRVIPTEAFFPLINIPNTQFYSFQTFEGSEETAKLIEKFDVIDIGKNLMNFGQTAAALENVDLVICNDTSLAHLAGAMGKPCYIILPYEVNWRWHENLGKCDWYDDVKLFRQKSIGDWSEVFEEVHTNINNILTPKK